MNSLRGCRIRVYKRDGRVEAFSTQKLYSNVVNVARHLNINVELWPVTSQVKITLQNYKITRITTRELSKKVAAQAMYCQQEHPDYATLARHIELINLHKYTPGSFAEIMTRLYNYRDPNTNTHSPIISRQLFEIAEQKRDLIENALIHENDNKYNYLALRILQESFLLKIDGEIVETPQHMLMRVALAIWPESSDAGFEVYKSLSNHYFVPSHLILENAGLQRQMFVTCAALTLNPHEPDLSDCLNKVQILGNIPMDLGIGITDVISEGRRISSFTEGRSIGVRGLFRLFHADTMNVPRHIPGLVSFYLEIWHADIVRFLNSYDDYSSRYINYNIVIPDIFMRRLMENSHWSLMCPSKCPRLLNICGEAFDSTYEAYEAKNRYERRMNCAQLWAQILNQQKKTGYPAIIFKDPITIPSNYKHLGPIITSNKYTNYTMPSSSKDPASAHSAYLILPTFCTHDSINLVELGRQVKIVTKFLDKAIDISHYATQGLKKHSKRNRPLAIGVHGLADVFQKLEISYFSLEAEEKNKKIFDTIYFNALEASRALAVTHGAYPNFRSSPMGQTLVLHVDYWNLDGDVMEKYENLRTQIKIDKERYLALKSLKCDLLQKIESYGVRNSTLISLKSDKITAQIMGVSNSVEPSISIKVQIEGFGEDFTIINERFMRVLIRERCWTSKMRRLINLSPDSLMQISQIGVRERDIFRTATEIPPNIYIHLATGRAPFVDQSQSTKIYFKSYLHSIRKHHLALEKVWTKCVKTLYKVVITNDDSCESVKLFRSNYPEDEIPVKITEDVGSRNLSASFSEKADKHTSLAKIFPIRFCKTESFIKGRG